MKITVDGVDLAPTNIDLRTVSAMNSDLGQQIIKYGFIIDEEKQTTPKVPKRNHEVIVYEDDNVTKQVGGFIRELEQQHAPGTRRQWKVDCQSYDVRTFETSTGSLTYNTLTSDRDMVIGIFRDGMKNQSFGSATSGVDDGIITVNEAAGWPNVQATTFLSGVDFSYKTVKAAMDQLLKLVPNVTWRIGPDKLLTYGVPRTLAPFVLHSSPDDVLLIPYERLVEREIVGDHRNKMRRGGASASESTAIDEVSYARFGIILADPYKNDTSVPSTQIVQRTAAELRTRRVKKVVRARTWKKGLAAGQLLDIVSAARGAGTIPSPFMSNLYHIYGRSVCGRLAGERGRFLVQKVTQVILANQKYAFDVEAGDNIKDFPTALAVLSGNSS